MKSIHGVNQDTTLRSSTIVPKFVDPHPITGASMRDLPTFFREQAVEVAISFNTSGRDFERGAFLRALIRTFDL